MASMSVAVVTAAPIAGPFTAATIGLGNSITASNNRWFLSRIATTSLDGAIGVSVDERSAPAE
eukprot:6528617-Prymnesium_polylepis.3